MTNTNRTSRRIITVIAAGSVALGSAFFGFTTSPGRTSGDGISTSPGRTAARPSGETKQESRSNVEKKQQQSSESVIKNVQALTNRKAGGGQQDYL